MKSSSGLGVGSVSGCGSSGGGAEDLVSSFEAFIEVVSSVALEFGAVSAGASSSVAVVTVAVADLRSSSTLWPSLWGL